jgi:hypothetical protein
VTDPDVPRLPRGRGIRLAGPQMVRIVMVATLLVAVIILQRPCGEAIDNFFKSFDPPAQDAAVKEAPTPPAKDPYEGRYHEIKPGMTEQEIEQVIEKAREESAPK